MLNRSYFSSALREEAFCRLEHFERLTEGRESFIYKQNCKGTIGTNICSHLWVMFLSVSLRIWIISLQTIHFITHPRSMKVRTPTLPLFVFKTKHVRDKDFFFLFFYLFLFFWEQTYFITEELLNHGGRNHFL